MATKSDREILREWQGNTPMKSFTERRVLNFMRLARWEEQKRIKEVI